MLISKNQKKYPPLSFLFLSPWPSNSLAVSDCFHSANTLPLAKRMLFTMSMMLGIGYSRSVMPSNWQVLIVLPNSMRSMILYGIWLSPPPRDVLHLVVDDDGGDVVLLLEDFGCLGGEGCGGVGAGDGMDGCWWNE